MKGLFNQLTSLLSLLTAVVTKLTMSYSLQIAVWNDNGLLQHRNKLQMFLLTHNIDILLISETHFTKASFAFLTTSPITQTIRPKLPMVGQPY
jgi:hypothetical protein